MADDHFLVSADLASAPSETDVLLVRNQGAQPFTLFIGGTFNATLELQCKRPEDADVDASYVTLESHTSPVVRRGVIGGLDLRVQMTARTSGTANVQISR